MAVNAVDDQIASVDQLKVELGLGPDDVSEEGRINAALAAASAAVSTFCGRRFSRRTYVDELYDGRGTPLLWLRNWPVTTPFSTSADPTGVTRTHTIYADPRRKWSSATLLVEDTSSVEGDFFVVPDEEGHGLIERVNGVWPVGTRNIKVTYQAGYALSSIPDDLQRGCLMFAAYLFTISKRGLHAQSSESIPGGGGIVSLPVREIPKDVKQLIHRYKRVRMGD